jgi:hypothetical protein
MAERRARGEEFASRINRAVELLSLGSRPAVVRGVLERECSLSARQALRSVRAAQAAPEGVDVPESTATFTVCRGAARRDGFEDDRAFEAKLGFTDVVKRATARGTGLRAGELLHGPELLEARLAALAVPRIIFTYKKAATTLLGRFDGFGLRPGRPLAGAGVFIMCGPMAKREDRARAIHDLREWWSS